MPWPAQLSAPISRLHLAASAAHTATHSFAVSAAARQSSRADAADYEQRQRRSRRSQQRSGDDDDDDFMDPLEAAKLRRQLKAQARSPAPITDTNTQPIEQQQKQHSRTDSNSTKQRLFSQSQLQAAAPGSAGTQPALPIVRPAAESSRSTPSPYRSSNNQGFFSSDSWEALGVSAEVTQALTFLGFNRPSHVQAEACKALRPKSGFRHVAVADQAGSGKTLAYLLPLLQQLKQQEAKKGSPVTTPNSPSLIIMTPTTGKNHWVLETAAVMYQTGSSVMIVVAD